MGDDAARRVASRRSVIAFFRRTPTIKRRSDGDFDVNLDAESREVIVLLLQDLSSHLTEAPDDPDLRRLSPPAYPEDAEADAAYQLLAGEELRTSHHEAVQAVIASLERKQVTEAELWSWLRALNSVRLVAGTRLDITDDDHGPLWRQRKDDLSEQERSLWAIYDFCTYLQYEVVKGLSS